MRKSQLSPCDPFALSPLLAVLPRVERKEGIRESSAALFARYEKVCALRDSSSGDTGSDEMRKRILAEENMLKVILDWLGGSSVVGDLQHSILPSDEE